jgi:hypothetical protein
MFAVSFVACGKKNDTARQPEKDKSNNTDQDSSSSPSAVVNNGSPIGPTKSGPPASAPALGSPSVNIRDGDVFKILNWNSIKEAKFKYTKECKLEFEITRSGNAEIVIIDHFKGTKTTQTEIGSINDNTALFARLKKLGGSYNTIEFFIYNDGDKKYKDIGKWAYNTLSLKVNNGEIEEI